MQYLRPSSDVSNSGWTASSGPDLYAMLDETSASDADYISNVFNGTYTYKTRLSTGGDPGSSADHTLRYRIVNNIGGAVAVSPSWTITILQGATTIASETRSANGTLTTYSLALSSGEADALDWGTPIDVQIEFTGQAISSNTRCTWVEFEVPDVVSSGGGEVEVPANDAVVQCQHPLPQVYTNGGKTATVTDIDKADIPVDMADAYGGEVCSFSGLWFPARRVVIVDGLPYGDIYAPRPEDDQEIFVP